jgi:hypothetical protein
MQVIVSVTEVSIVRTVQSVSFFLTLVIIDDCNCTPTFIAFYSCCSSLIFVILMTDIMLLRILSQGL